jgi:G3E family GTPase
MAALMSAAGLPIKSTRPSSPPSISPIKVTVSINSAMTCANSGVTDLLILNKNDLIDEDAVASLERRIGVIKPRARQIRAVFGRAPTAAILSVAEEPAIANQRDRHHAHPHDHILADGFSAHAVSINEPISAARFQAWLNEGFPRAVFRAKGIIRFDRPVGWFVFQLCGDRASFEPYSGSPAQGGMVFIGRDIDAPALERRLEQCLAPSG